jgi:hypothetical protein
MVFDVVDHQRYGTQSGMRKRHSVYDDGLCCYAGLYLVAVGACSGRHLRSVQAAVEGFSAATLRRRLHLEHQVRRISSCWARLCH